MLSNVNHRLLALLNLDEINVVIRLAEEAEVDEMWSYVQRKKEPRWLWHAIDHLSGNVLAYVFGRRQDEVFLKLKALLEPFGIKRYDTDYYGGLLVKFERLPVSAIIRNTWSQLDRGRIPRQILQNTHHQSRGARPNGLSVYRRIVET